MFKTLILFVLLTFNIFARSIETVDRLNEDGSISYNSAYTSDSPVGAAAILLISGCLNKDKFSNYLTNDVNKKENQLPTQFEYLDTIGK
ncbi:hypothetical protein KKG72_02845 [bacterium]|nr:hypothetical protein [bacterium]MBU1994229.1 hypothetical protein [bacterium]